MTEFDGSHTTLLSEAIRRHRVPGASFAIHANGRTHISVAGVLNAALDAPVRPDSMFQIGSITKPFTATLLMQMVEEGRVGLDQPIRDHLFDFRMADPEASQSATPAAIALPYLRLRG